MTSVLSLSKSHEGTISSGRGALLVVLLAFGPDFMLDVAEKPRLLVTHKDTAHVYAVCSLCEHRLHAFIRSTEDQARLLLNRGFKQHCRMRHEMVIPVPTKISTPRRSTRVAADVLVEVKGERVAWAGKTITVNLHGALIEIAAPLKLGDRVSVHVHGTGKSATAEVVFADLEASQFGVELDTPENIWGFANTPTDWTASPI